MEVFVEFQKIGNLYDISIWLLITYFFTIIFSILDLFLFKTLFKIKTTTFENLVFIFTSGFFKFLGIIVIPFPYYQISATIITIIFFKIVFKENIEKCILAEMINLICIIGGEIIFTKLWVYMFSNIDTHIQGIYNYRYKTCLYLSIVIVRIIISYIIKSQNLSIKIKENLTIKNQMNISIIAITGALVAFFYSFGIIYKKEYPYIFCICNFLFMILYLIVCLKDIVEISILEEKNTQIENLEAYNKTLTIMYDSMRGFKHDYANFIQALNGYAQTNNINGIKKMCNSVVKEYKDINNMGILISDLINNSAIYSIITNKFYLARENNIEMNIEVFINFEEIENDIYEISKMLSIFLDNAIEASKKCDKKIINVRFLQDYNTSKKLIIIENTYNNKDIDIKKLFEKGYTTKVEPKDEHGLGLWTVEKILKKNKNFKLVTTNNEMFCQTLEIYNNNKEEEIINQWSDRNIPLRRCLKVYLKQFDNFNLTIYTKKNI